MFNQITFEYPYFLILLMPFMLCSFFCKEKSPSFLFVHLNMFSKVNSKSKILLNTLKFFIYTFAIIALASPIKIINEKPIKKDGIDIVLSLDSSGSMKEMGLDENNLYENRWDVVKSIVNDFIDKRENDNIGLVIFGTNVMTASPLSFDKNAQKEILKYLEIGMVGEKTALIDSIINSIKILKNSNAKSKVIVLLSDGMDTASKIPYKVANDLAIKHNIKLYTIGIGDSNRTLLNLLSTGTGGNSYIAISKADLINIYEEINTLEKSKIDDKNLQLKDYLFFYPLFISVFSLIIFIYLKNRD